MFFLLWNISLGNAASNWHRWFLAIRKIWSSGPCLSRIAGAGVQWLSHLNAPRLNGFYHEAHEVEDMTGVFIPSCASCPSWPPHACYGDPQGAGTEPGPTKPLDRLDISAIDLMAGLCAGRVRNEAYHTDWSFGWCQSAGKASPFQGQVQSRALWARIFTFFQYQPAKRRERESLRLSLCN